MSLLQNPVDYLVIGAAPRVPKPYSVVQENDRIPTSNGWFQHWSVKDARGRKLKGGIMVQRSEDHVRVTTYRDGVHKTGVDVPWLLTRQQ